jgi:hypothetical protein
MIDSDSKFLVDSKSPFGVESGTRSFVESEIQHCMYVETTFDRQDSV